MRAPHIIIVVVVKTIWQKSTWKIQMHTWKAKLGIWRGIWRVKKGTQMLKEIFLSNLDIIELSRRCSLWINPQINILLPILGFSFYINSLEIAKISCEHN